MAITAGYDVGGAHLKVALAEDGRTIAALQLPCPLWRGLDRLDAAFAQAAPLVSRAMLARHVNVSSGWPYAGTTIDTTGSSDVATASGVIRASARHVRMTRGWKRFPHVRQHQRIDEAADAKCGGSLSRREQDGFCHRAIPSMRARWA